MEWLAKMCGCLFVVVGGGGGCYCLFVCSSFFLLFHLLFPRKCLNTCLRLRSTIQLCLPSFDSFACLLAYLHVCFGGVMALPLLLSLAVVVVAISCVVVFISSSICVRACVRVCVRARAREFKESAPHIHVQVS